MNSKTVLSFLVVVFGASFAFSKNEIRQPASLGCNKNQVSAYVKDNVLRYQQMVKDGKLSPDEGQALIKGVNDIVEMNALGCGWVKPPTQKAISFCEQVKINKARWEKMSTDGLLSRDEVNELLTGQRTLAAMANSNCN
ncbi:MAG: hypothetical protein OM95_01665 [Bdellovibrio sp. ArHS]|uniref:hypothetical protein n=1 Tax=Bdellovibrio sp. ArHS TaxID=1569284 RepID=UPI00058301C7|nr:hypothetical protein [Bdellovibrio sp. ArHS]KHD89802.1 MAG: hypothetical protein OM95_01665 [Bdellovibrio sp. ArHS]